MKKLKKIIIAFIVFGMSIIVNAEAVSTADTFNPNLTLSWIVVTLIALLGIIIHILGKVLISVLKNKININKKTLVILPLLAFMHPFIADAQTAEASSSGMSNNTFWIILLSILVMELIIIGLFSNLILSNLRTEKALSTSKKPIFAFLTSSKFWNKFNKTKALSEEKSILLDHSYDGIQELDNDLPPWWKYGFYLSIVWAVFYMFYYHVGATDKGQIDEYTREVAEGEAEVAAFKSTQKLNVDENTVTLLHDAVELEKGATLYAKNCTPCHGVDAGGSIGPNLTDKYWLYGGSINNVFKTIKYGANNGMKAWEEFSPIEMQQVSSYVLSLQGSKPATPKDPQGDLYTAEGEADISIQKDSAAVIKTDSI